METGRIVDMFINENYRILKMVKLGLEHELDLKVQYGVPRGSALEPLVFTSKGMLFLRFAFMPALMYLIIRPASIAL